MLTETLIGLLVVALLTAVFLRWEVIEDGTAVLFKYLGRVAYVAMQYTGHCFEDGVSVEKAVIREGTGENGAGECGCIWRIGGVVIYLWPFVRPAKYADYNDPKDGFSAGENVIRLGDVASNPFTSVAETTELEPGEKPEEAGSVGVSIKFTSKMRVVNPFLFLIESPWGVIKEAVEDRQDGVLARWVFNGDKRHAQAAKGNGAKLWDELKLLGLTESFNESRDDWGLEIVENSIIVKEVIFDTDYQKALQAGSQQKLVAKGEKARIFDPITDAMTDWVKSQMPSFQSKSFDEVSASLQKVDATGPNAGTSPYERKEAEKTKLRAMVIAADAGGLNDVRVDINSGGESLNGADMKGVGLILGGIFAAAQAGKSPGRQGGQGNRNNGKNPGRVGNAGVPPVSRTDAELIKDAEDFYKQYGTWPGWDPSHRGG